MDKNRTTRGTEPSMGIEHFGLEFIEARDRHGTPFALFWVYAAGASSTFGISYGAFLSVLGLNFWQSVITGISSITLSAVFCGIISLGGKRGNVPTMVLSRAAFGVRGNRLPTVISGLMSLGWQTILAVIASLAAETVAARFGLSAGPWIRVSALILILVVVVLIGIFGYDALIKAMRILTPLSVLCTAGYIAIGATHIDWHRASGAQQGSSATMVGAFLLILAGSGLTLCRVSADYSRYLPRTSSSIGTVIWPIVGSIIPATVLIAFGAALANSDPGLGHAVAGDPIGALTAILPIWYLVPFVTVVIVTTIMACAIDIYSGSLALLAVGAPLKRFQATLVAGTACLLAALYILCFGQEFFGQFQGILITLGMPVAAWAGIMCTDIGLRRAGYSDQDLRSTTGRYGDVRWSSLWVLILACAIGWGLVTNTTAGWLGWQGYLLGPIGGRTGAWSHSNLGILVAILIGAAGYLIVGTRAVRLQEHKLGSQ